MATPGTFELPKGTINKLIHNANPDLKVRKESKLAIQRATEIFILYLAHNANLSAKNSKRSTIQAADVLKALKEIEFGGYNDELNQMLTSYRAEQQQIKDAKKAKKAASVAAEESDVPMNDAPADQ